jgi:signal transduction histidine kinase
MAQRIQHDMKSRDQLLRDISHELRSPLARMLVALEFILKETFARHLNVTFTALETMTASILKMNVLTVHSVKSNCCQSI